MRTSSNQNQIEWEKRAGLLGANLNSVLLKNAPYILNQHFHNWQEQIIFQCLKDKPETTTILDVGCGYGRLSSDLLDKFPNINITGLDISHTFLKIYKKTLKSPVVLGNIDHIPLKPTHFDFIICVTVLMFVEDDKLHRAVDNLLACLKRSGTLIIIENNQSGAPFLTGFGLARIFRNYFTKTKVHTSNKYFKHNQIRQLILATGGSVKSEYRLPATTLCFLPLQIIARLLPLRLTTKILNIVSRLDGLLSKAKLPSIWVAYIAERDRA